MPTSMASTRFSASRFFSIAASQSIPASFQGGGIFARAGEGWIEFFRIFFCGLTGAGHPQAATTAMCRRMPRLGEGIPEMRTLKEIAFVPMTYTMDLDQPPVAEFKPAVVYPYHHKGSDPEAFAAKVGKRGRGEGGAGEVVR
jgi:hypothetical protein